MKNAMDGMTPGSIAAIFTSRRNGDDPEGHAAAADAMVAAAAAMPGYVGVDSVRDAAGCGITVSSWQGRASAEAWRDDARYRQIRDDGRARWYEDYPVHVPVVECGYRWKRSGEGSESPA